MDTYGERMNLILGDCLEKLKKLDANSVDAIVTDPPYGLKFMGKKWDYDVPSTAVWLEAIRVLKPGGHLLSFGGTRTYHRMVVAIEDAGFEIRDQVQWIYGSGFPKSLDISKAIDKAAGAEREVIGKKLTYREPQSPNGWDCTKRAEFETAPATDSAKQWQGFGTALKPANEPIVLARKPLEKGLTVAENVLKYGTGALNIDGGRVGTDSTVRTRGDSQSTSGWNSANRSPVGGSESGRWPANVLLDEAAAEMLDTQTGELHPSGNKSKNLTTSATSQFGIGVNGIGQTTDYKDSGGASRFFYVAKASKRERNAGLEGMPVVRKSHMQTKNGEGERSMTEGFPDTFQQNHHPTVKPVKLMEYLCRLITPPKGTILDPFMGSGSTGVAAKRLGFEFIGIEMNEEYLEIAKKRMEFARERIQDAEAI